MAIAIQINDTARYRCISDLLIVYKSDTYMNIKGYLQKLIELLYEMGYYEDNKSLFPKGQL